MRVPFWSFVAMKHVSHAAHERPPSGTIYAIDKSVESYFAPIKYLGNLIDSKDRVSAMPQFPFRTKNTVPRVHLRTLSGDIFLKIYYFRDTAFLPSW